MMTLFFDSTIYRYYKNKLRLEEERQLLTYTIPKLSKVKFNNDNPEEIILFKYPSHYRHFKYAEYNFGIKGWFGLLTTIFMYMGIKGFYKTLSYKKLLIFSFFSLVSSQETYIAHNRVKDVKSLVIKDGKKILIETFQDKDYIHETDLKNLRIANKHHNDLIVLIDTEQAKKKNFRFYFMEPSPGTVNNLSLFQTVILDQRYIKY